MATEKRDEIVFQIKAHLGDITNRRDGWKKELNLVSWNGQEPPKFDIRDWSEDHTKMGKGITLYDDEMRKVTQYYTQFCNAKIVSESRNNRNAAAQAGLKAGAEMREREEASIQQKETGEHDAENADAINDSSLAAENKVQGNDNEGEEDFDALDQTPEMAGSDMASESQAETAPF